MDPLTIFVVWTATSAITLAIIGALAYLLRRKHRFLFAEILKNRNAIENSVVALRADARKAYRKLEHVHEHPDLQPKIPFEFHSQYGEDTYLYDLFRDREAGFFVEAGAFDGVMLSNTYFLESIGWQGLLVEAHPDLYAKCKSNRPHSTVVHAALGPPAAAGEIEFTCADGTDEASPLSFVRADPEHESGCRDLGYALRTVPVPYASLNALLHGLTDRVDFLSLDVEGMELDVLRGLDIRTFRPDAVLVESNTREGEVAVAQYLASRDYEHAAKIGPNSLYVADRRLADRLRSY